MRDERLDRVFVAGIGLHRKGRAAVRLDAARGVDYAVGNVHSDHRSSLACGQLACRAADPAGGAGDDDVFAFKHAHGDLPPIEG